MTLRQQCQPLQDSALRVLYFGSYDRGDSRNTILIEGLRSADVVVTECHAWLWADTDAKLRAARVVRHSARAATGLLRTSRSLRAQHRGAGPYDVMVVGSTAHLDLPLARRLARGAGRPLVFDPLVSIVETVRDRGLAAPGSWRLRAFEAFERWLVSLPDLVLVDSATHGEALRQELSVADLPVATVPAGAPAGFRRLATPYRLKPAGRALRVVYFGQFIPLHGLEHVVRAASYLTHRDDIEFRLVGVGQQLTAVQSMVAGLGLTNVRFDARWHPVDQLAASHVAEADVCLGVFGAQPKTDRVVPFKVYTALASARATITGDTSAVRELLIPGSEVWTVPPADPTALAGAIEHLADNPELRMALAASGQSAYDERFDREHLGRIFRDALIVLRSGSAAEAIRPGADRAS